MYDRYILNSLNVPDSIGQSLMNGGNMFYRNYTTGTKQEYTTIQNKAQILDHTKITQDLIHGPFAFIMRPLHLTGFDEAELSNENYSIHHIGGYVFGNFDSLELPVWKYSNNTMTGDLLGSMLYSALTGNMQLAMAYLRSAQLFMSINKSSPVAEVQADDLKLSRQISLNRL